MNVALVYPKFNRSGGEEIYASDLAVGLARRNHAVHMLGRCASVVPAGAQFKRLHTLRFPRWLKTWSFCRVADRAASRLRVDVIQGFAKTTCQTVHHPGGGVHRGYLERKVLEGFRLYDRIVLDIEDRLYAAPHLRSVVCPSGWVAGEVARFYPRVEPLLHIIPNGVDLRVFEDQGRAEDCERLRQRLRIAAGTPLLLFVAHNFHLKGLDLAVAGLAGFHEAHLVVVGSGTPAQYAEQALSLGVRDRVHFLGPQSDLPPLYRAADVFVHPTRYEPFGNVCVEALACGTPLVTTENAGAMEGLGECPAVTILRHPAGGRDVGAAAESLWRAGADLRGTAREASQVFSQEQHVRAVEAVYQSLTDGPD